MKIDLSNKTALITGATGQLGRVMTRTLASCGANVAIHYSRNQDMAHQLQKELDGLGVRSAIVQADVTSPDSVSAMRDSALKKLGDVHILINNAVVQYTWTTVLEQD